MAWWMIPSAIAAAVAVVSVIVFYWIPVNACAFSPSQRASDLMAPVSPKELYDSAELVVIGRITESTAKCEGSQIWTHMQIAVEDSAKNPQGIMVLTGKAYGGKIGNYGLWVEDSPIFEKGDRAFLYLYKDKPSDSIYRITPYSGVLAANDLTDETISAKEILKTFRLQPVTNGNGPAADIQQGSTKEVALSLESFFGYDSPTNVTVSSFTYYNSSTADSFNTANVTALNDFGLSVEPIHIKILPRLNGTIHTEFGISASDKAVLGVYDIVVSAEEDDRYSYLAGGVTSTNVRINVTDDASVIQQSVMQPPGISLLIEDYGEREFYQDRKVFLPTILAVTKNESLDWERLAWPSIGPNYVISRIDPAMDNKDGSMLVFDYYRSLGIDANLAGIVYDEFMTKSDLSPPPTTSGRYFGFEWNQTALDGTPANAGRYEVVLTMPVLIDEMTTWDDKRSRIMLRSEPDYFSILEGSPRYLEHNLFLTLTASKTELETGEPFRHSLLLVNNGNRSEYFSIDAGGADFFSQEGLATINGNEQAACYFPSANGIKREEWGHMSMYAHYFLGEKTIVSGGSLAIADDTPISAPKYPGVYYLAGKITLTIADEEVKGKSEFDSVKVSCLDVAISNPVMLNVSAPIYEGVNLVLETDKQVYKQNETVILSLYIENDSEKSFKLQEVFPSISIRDNTGKEVYGISWVADYFEYPTIAPHSRYNLNIGTPLTWDQTTYLEDGITKPAEPGEYSISATFTSPYLKSDEHAIWIED